MALDYRRLLFVPGSQPVPFCLLSPHPVLLGPSASSSGFRFLVRVTSTPVEKGLPEAQCDGPVVILKHGTVALSEIQSSTVALNTFLISSFLRQPPHGCLQEVTCSSEIPGCY